MGWPLACETGLRASDTTLLAPFSNDIREVYLLARWGGENFVLACINTNSAHAVLAEKLRRAVAEHAWMEGIKVSASFGTAETLDDVPISSIGRADEALYEAKAKGRNCIVIA